MGTKFGSRKAFNHKDRKESRGKAAAKSMTAAHQKKLSF
jgi:hypothetical protein